MSSADIDTPLLKAARERIAQAYDAELLRTSGVSIVDLLADHVRDVENCSGRVLNWNLPEDNIAEAERLLEEGDASGAGESPADRMRSLAETILSRGQNMQDPRYIGHQVPASIPLAGLFDAVASVTNSVMAVYEMGPWATAAETALINEIGRLVGYSEGTFSGLITHGGSLANLTALLTARNVALEECWQQGVPGGDGRPVIVAHGAAHYCIERAVGILGIGTNQCLKAPLDERGRMDPARLDELLQSLKEQNLTVIAVSASACATPIGAFDPLHAIADVCEKHGVWLHVDAAHGGAACFSETYRHLIAGLERADSFICDAHKMMFMPALCAFVFYKNREHRYSTFQQDAPYLFDPSAPDIREYDSGLKTIECTKRSAAFTLWGIWSTFGRQLFADLVDVTFSMGKTFHEKLTAAEDFEPLHEPECNIVVFRYLPAEIRGWNANEIGLFQLRLRRKLIESGEFYIVPFKMNGIGAMRCTIINPLTTPEHLDLLMETLRRQGRELLGDKNHE
jgi:L-2,4-diaminobutyrate decarboxylase